jgi:hypothetical protein
LSNSSRQFYIFLQNLKQLLHTILPSKQKHMAYCKVSLLWTWRSSCLNPNPNPE